jgi:hypothetical protein
MNRKKRKDLYKQRLDLIRGAIAFEPVDRIPVAFIGTAFCPIYMDVPISHFVLRPKVQRKVVLDTIEKLGGIDAINAPIAGAPMDVALASIWLSKVRVPGRELPEGSLWQVAEEELMTVDDYDTILEQGWSKFQSHYLPKVLNHPRDFQKMIFWTIINTPSAVRRYKNAGYVLLNGAVTTFPFESLCGGRSMKKFFLDLYRIPDKVEAVMDVMLPAFIKNTLRAGKTSRALGLWIGGWRSASSFLSPKIWDRFVFPYLQKTVEAVTDAGLIAILHFDQDWTRDLPRLKELPAKKCLLNIDGMTNIRKAKEVLDGHMAILGDIPSSLFAAGTPDDIYNYVRDLVRDIGPTGLILCPGCDAPINTKPENMEAFIAAGREFGKIH